MGLILDLLTAPFLGPIRGVCWLGEKLTEAGEDELMDEGRVRRELSELQMRLQVGEVSDEEYDQQEALLLERLAAIRKAKAEQNQP